MGHLQKCRVIRYSAIESSSQLKQLPVLPGKIYTLWRQKLKARESGLHA